MEGDGDIDMTWLGRDPVPSLKIFLALPAVEVTTADTYDVRNIEWPSQWRRA